MIINWLHEKEKMTETEKGIADYILSNLEKIKETTSVELAEDTYTSRSSINRFCKKLGLNGYHELQIELEKEISEHNTINKLMDNEPINENTTYQNSLKILPNLYKNSINQTEISIDHEVVERLINSIYQAEKTYLFGTGISYNIAEGAAFKFNTLGIDARAFDGFNEHYFRTKKDYSNHIALLFSFTGNNSAMLSISKMLNEIGVYTVAIVGDRSRELSEYTEDILEFKPQKKHLSLEIVDSFISVTYIIDIITVNLLTKDYDKHIDVALEVLKNSDNNN